MCSGFLKKPTIQARIHGLDRHYYSLVIDWRKNDLEEQILQNLNKKDWTAGLLVKVGSAVARHVFACLHCFGRFLNFVVICGRTKVYSCLEI